MHHSDQATEASVEADEAADRPAELQGMAHHPRRPRAQRQRGPGAPELIREMWFFMAKCLSTWDFLSSSPDSFAMLFTNSSLTPVIVFLAQRALIRPG